MIALKYQNENFLPEESKKQISLPTGMKHWQWF